MDIMLVLETLVSDVNADTGSQYYTQRCATGSTSQARHENRSPCSVS